MILPGVAVFFVLAQSTGTVTGNITDAVTHEPLHAAQVRAVSGSHDLTEVDGSYELRGLPAGEVKFRVVSSGHRPLEKSLQLAPGETAKLDLELRPLARVTGRMVDSDTGEPIGGRVRLQQKGGDRVAFSPSDDRGVFDIDNLEPGDYTVTRVGIDNAGMVFGPQSGKQSRQAYGDAAETAVIHLDDGEQKVFDLRLPAVPSYRVTGTLQLPPNREAEPVALALHRGHEGSAPFAGHAGPFGIEGLTAGQYSLSAIAGKGTERLYGTVIFTITDHDIDGLKLTTSSTASLSGTLQMVEDGAALPKELMIMLESAEGLGSAPPFGHAKGARFLIDGIVPGRYWASFFMLPPGYAVMRGDGRPLDIYGATTLPFLLTSKAGAIVGTVRDENQKPVSGVMVQLSPDGSGDVVGQEPGSRTSSGAAGEFTFPNLAPGKYRVNGSPVEVGFGQTVAVTVRANHP